MNKLFIISLLLVVALAAKAPETNADCEKIGCKQCAFADRASKKCKTASKGAKALECVAVTACYDDVKAADDKKAKKAAKKLQETYGKLCPTDKAKCVDTSANCPTWATSKPSECTKNPDWMLPKCAKSCCPLCTGKNTLKNTGTCPPKDRKDLCVKNTHSSCHAWATKKKSECTENPKWMRSNCMESCCNVCKTAVNKCPTVKESCANKYAKPSKKKGNAKCVEWAKNGECKSNPNWMNSNCSKECCAVCAAAAPVQAQPVRLVQQAPRQVVYGGYSTGLPYYGR